MAKNMVRASI